MKRRGTRERKRNCKGKHSRDAQYDVRKRQDQQIQREVQAHQASCTGGTAQKDRDLAANEPEPAALPTLALAARRAFRGDHFAVDMRFVAVPNAVAGQTQVDSEFDILCQRIGLLGYFVEQCVCDAPPVAAYAA